MRVTLFTLFSLVFFSSCSQPNSIPGLEYQYKSGYFKMKTLTWIYGPYRPYSKYVTSAFKAYKLTYQSEVQGSPVTLSGSILIPRDYKDEKKGIVVFCHGTTFGQNVASNWDSPMHIETLSAMNGYITFLPDYIGYGVSAGEMPAYMNKEITVNHVQDFIEKGMEVLDNLQITHSKDVYALGFSQGGHAVLALAENKSVQSGDTFQLKAGVSIGGPVDLNAILDYILKKDSFLHSAYLTYIFSSYNHYYWGMKPTNFFDEPFAQLAQGFEERTVSLRMLRDSTSQHIKTLMNDGFLLDFLNNSNHLIRPQFSLNSIEPFASKIPIYLVHGELDEVVPFEVVHKFYQELNEMNKPNVIQLILLEGASHNESGMLGMSLALDLFNGLDLEK